ncbi:hypothetical protein VL06_02015 [Rossellomorea marisflavi]|nr:hypothetical protein VL06_02015 [Rossellomorea marisflavi]KML31301.1 hypothetical protein VL12_18345 [Rossellomorea marisflavi]
MRFIVKRPVMPPLPKMEPFPQRPLQKIIHSQKHSQYDDKPDPCIHIIPLLPLVDRSSRSSEPPNKSS